MTTAPIGAQMRRGPFRDGERVQLTDPKGRLTTLTLSVGKSFHTHKGSFGHDELIGAPEGSVVSTTAGVEYLALRPLLADYVLSMPRGAAVIYPKDAAQIVTQADIYPGARVVEAGVGSGALTLSLLRAVGESGSLLSIERREDFAEIARGNVETFFGEHHPAWELRTGDLQDVLPAGLADGTIAPGSVDRVVLDMLAPWECFEAVEHALAPGGVLLAYLATTTQMSRFAEDAKNRGSWTEPVAWESMVRGWHLEGLSVRPDHRMVAHTGFLVTTRKMAPGVTAPIRRRRPAPGAYSEPVNDFETADLAVDVGERGVSAKKVRRVLRGHDADRSRRAGSTDGETPEPDPQD